MKLDFDDLFFQVSGGLLALNSFPTRRAYDLYTGSGKWKGDERVVRNDLYCLPQPIKDQDAQGKEPLARIELPAKNGTYIVDKDKEGTPLSLERFECKDTYVFVTSSEGDSRTQAFRSSETETVEQYTLLQAPPPTTPPPSTPPPSTLPPTSVEPTVISETAAPPPPLHSAAPFRRSLAPPRPP